MRGALALASGVLFTAAASLERDGEASLELVYLANEGFLVRAGEQALLIDAFVTEPFSGYAAVPAAIFADLVAAKPPYDGIDQALASHYHDDHFQTAAAAEFLRARPEVAFLSSQQVLDKLLAAHDDFPSAERFEAFLPEAGAVVVAREKDIRVELVRAPHSGGAAAADVQNFAHRIELGGMSLLHLGDADAADARLPLEPMRSRPVDVALVPYWWLGDAESVKRAREITGARELVAVHVPPDELAAVQQRLAALDPSVLVFARAGESRKIASARER